MENKLRVLIVDDENTNITVLRATLEKDYVVQISKNGQQALDIVTKSIPDLILLDIVMPDMDGYAVCTALKSKPETKHIPIIFITSEIDAKNEAKGLRLGAVDYITKPFNPVIVKERVKTHLELKVYREQLESQVKMRTQALSDSNNELQNITKKLYESNIALNVLLEKKEEAQNEYKEHVLHDIENLIQPYLTKIKQDPCRESQDVYIDIIQSNLDKLIASSAVNLNSIGFKLTPAELQIANWIKEGKNTKNIAQLTKLVDKTVEWHRGNIREKLGLTNQKVNLRTYLNSMSA